MKGNGAIRMGAAFALLFASLTLVVWRQSRALEELRALDEARTTRAVLQSERSALQREIQRLESRARIATVAGQRLGLRVPGVTETIYLHAPVDGDSEVSPSRLPRRGQLTVVEP